MHPLQWCLHSISYDVAVSDQTFCYTRFYLFSSEISIFRSICPFFLFTHHFSKCHPFSLTAVIDIRPKVEGAFDMTSVTSLHLLLISASPLIFTLSVSPRHSLPQSLWVTLLSLLPSPCEGGQLLSDGRIRASDSLPRVHARESTGDPQHLFLFHQLCRGSVGHIWQSLSLIASKCPLF